MHNIIIINFKFRTYYTLYLMYYTKCVIEHTIHYTVTHSEPTVKTIATSTYPKKI